MLDSFFKYLQFEKRYSPRTISSYKNDLSQFQQFLSVTFEEEDPSRATHGLIRSWIVQLVGVKDGSQVNQPKNRLPQKLLQILLKGGGD